MDEVEAADFHALVIPGGYAPDILRRSARVLSLTREIHQAGKPVAFICHAGWVPISAGSVRGRRGTSVGAMTEHAERQPIDRPCMRSHRARSAAESPAVARAASSFSDVFI